MRVQNDLPKRLESALLDALSIPRGVRAGKTARNGASFQWREGELLRQQLSNLHGAAHKVGTIPVGYPKHVDLLMRVIAALLPWYTRSLREFAQETVRTQQTMGQALESLAQRIDRVSQEEQG